MIDLSFRGAVQTVVECNIISVANHYVNNILHKGSIYRRHHGQIQKDVFYVTFNPFLSEQEQLVAFQNVFHNRIARNHCLLRNHFGILSRLVPASSPAK